VFLLILRFLSPDGKEETVYVVLAPSGAVALRDVVGKEIDAYVHEFGNIESGDWIRNSTNSNCKQINHNNYLS